MAKKKRKRARKSSSAPAAKKRRRTKKRRAAAAAPKKRRRSSKRRAAKRTSAPRRTKRRRASSMSAAPRKRRRRSKRRIQKVRSYKRRVRRNPDIPTWAMVGLAGLAGLASYALFGAGSFALTQRIDPSMATLERNRYIAGSVATVLGGAVALLASPIIGAGLVAGGLVSLGGTDLYLALGKVLDKAPAASPPAQQTTKGLFRDGAQQLGALEQGNNQILGIGGLYRAGEQQLGNVWGPAYQ